VAHRDIVAMGASAGGLAAFRTVLGDLPADLPAAVFVVLHVRQRTGLLAQVLRRFSALPVHEALDGEPIRAGHVYVAKPDHHLLLGALGVRVLRGPKQNRSRPAIDPLFRSAAAAFGPRVIGVILTGNLHDGTSGLQAVKHRGGIALVQEPEEAAFPGMPRSAVDHVDVDQRLPLAAIGAAVTAAVRQDIELREPTPRPDLEVEVRSDAEKIAGTHGHMGTWTHGHMDTWTHVRFRRVGHTCASENVVAEQVPQKEPQAG
jgi:two-component system chemotaxis response regulator CheB